METLWDNIIGHQEKIAELKALLQENKLPHALLITGQKGIGKRKIADTLASVLLKIDFFKAAALKSHPDFYEVAPDYEDEKGVLIHPKIIKIDDVRAMQTAVSRYSLQGNGRVVIIDEAERMNEAAANSLLKTLEEPPDNVTFILIAETRSALLDTIISRTMPLALGMLSSADIERALIKRNIAEPIAKRLSTLAGGSLGRAISLYEHGGLDSRDEAMNFLAKLNNLDMMKVWTLAKEKGELEPAKIADFLLYLNMLLRDILLLQEDGGSNIIYNSDIRAELIGLLPSFPAKRCYYLIALVRDLQQRMCSNANLKLQLEGFLIRASGL